MKKLSPTQVRVLRALAAPGARAEYCTNRRWQGQYKGPGWLLPALAFAEINTMRVLVNGGFIQNDHDTTATITRAGREYLASLDHDKWCRIFFGAECDCKKEAP